uniref:Uncharacterized protein n=1 Tax=Tetranychus urticae TaxID=32264 RepID=T1K2L3_TETUR
MNNCLADLSKLIPTSYFKKTGNGDLLMAIQQGNILRGC